MSYRLQSNETFKIGLPRIAREQLSQALANLTDPAENWDEMVHDTRKRCKKLRAVVRLVRDEMGEAIYKRENIAFRDAGRELAPLRDSYVMVKTVERLRTHYETALAEDAFTAAHSALKAQYEEAYSTIHPESEAVETAVSYLKDARRRITTWPIQHQEFTAVAPSLKRVYKRGYKGLARAADDPVSPNFHEWRKRVKYLWYHMRLLRYAWDDLLDELADEIHDLSDYLGDDHDLAILRDTLLAQSDLAGSTTSRQALLALISRRRKTLEESAFTLGRRIYAEKPKRFVGRIGTYWDVWRAG